MERTELILDGLDVSRVEGQESPDSESDVTLFCDGVVFKSSTSTKSRFFKGTHFDKLSQVLVKSHRRVRASVSVLP